MLQTIRDKKKENAGFTIIEVLIVLAIAGLILVVVLIAIPQLQRNQRNEARRSIISRVSTEINGYSGNNNGDIPETAPTNELPQIYDRYLGCDAYPVATDCDVDISDPSSGDPMELRAANVAIGGVPNINDDSIADGGNLGQMFYQEGRTCDGETVLAGDGRSFILLTVLEGGAIYCVDNG